MMLKKIFNALVYTLVGVLLFVSCSTTSKIKTADQAFNMKSYSIAATMFKTEYGAEDEPKKKAEKAFKAAESYRFNNQPKEAEKWYEEAVRLGYDPVATLNYALVLKSNEKYQRAIEQFTNYAKLDPFNKQRALDEIKSCQLALKWQKEKDNIELVNLKAINSNANDYGPVFDQSRNIIFTSDRVESTGNDTYGWTGEKYMDLFLAKRETDGAYTSLVPFSTAINSGANDGVPSFTADNSEMYFTRCGSQGKEDDFCGLFYSSIQSLGGWSDPQPLKFFDIDTINVGQPFVFRDGSALLFASNAPGGYGGKDLYIVRRTPEGWTKPVNLGTAINTAGDEMFPYLDEEGTLYFASSGLPGLGGLDIFAAAKKGDEWTEPQNLKLPINSGSDDFGLIMEKIKPANANDPVRQIGYFTSNRPGGLGKDDIYQFTLSNENLYVMDGIVLEKIFADPKNPNSKVIDFKPIDSATVTLFKLENGMKDMGSVYTDKNGKFKYDLEKNSNYSVSGKKDGFLKRTVDATTKGKRDLKNTVITVKVRILLERIYEEKDITIPNIYYDYDSTALRKESEVVLDTIVNMMKDNPEIKVQIGSHTDSRGSDEYNAVLSQGRAESVVRYLISKGINPQRLTAKGYGESMLINKCANDVTCTEEEHQENRRTTFRILSEKFIIESITPENIPVDEKKN
ncbi:MAG: OmpA family protein [Chitinophagales bacterium]|nr:OmpA family protein [Chitinophagales bacterium]